MKWDCTIDFSFFELCFFVFTIFCMFLQILMMQIDNIQLGLSEIKRLKKNMNFFNEMNLCLKIYILLDNKMDLTI